MSEGREHQISHLSQNSVQGFFFFFGLVCTLCRKSVASATSMGAKISNLCFLAQKDSGKCELFKLLNINISRRKNVRYYVKCVCALMQIAEIIFMCFYLIDLKSITVIMSTFMTCFLFFPIRLFRFPLSGHGLYEHWFP